MTKTCPHAASGCNYPEGDCPGHCAGKQQPEALRLAGVLDLLAMDMKTPRQAAAEQIGEIVALKAQRDELIGALHLALEYWAHREQRYKNRSPVWVQKSREAIAKAGGAA